MIKVKFGRKNKPIIKTFKTAINKMPVYNKDDTQWTNIYFEECWKHKSEQ